MLSQNTLFVVILQLPFLTINITATISDHLPQLLVSPNIFANPSFNKFNVLMRETGQIWPGKYYLRLLWYRLGQSFIPE